MKFSNTITLIGDNNALVMASDWFKR